MAQELVHKIVSLKKELNFRATELMLKKERRKEEMEDRKHIREISIRHFELANKQLELLISLIKNKNSSFS